MTAPASPTRAQQRWLRRGLDQPGGKLPLFDRQGQEVPESLVRACLSAGWAEPWFANPLKPDWQVCRLTDSGRAVATAAATEAEEPSDRAETTDPLDRAETVDEILDVLREEVGIDEGEPEDASADEPRLF